VIAGLGTAVAATSDGAGHTNSWGVFIGVIAVVLILVVGSTRRERARRQHLWTYALRSGWSRVPTDAALPWPVVEAAGSVRARMVVGARIDRFDVWLVWHHWTESGSENSTRDLTRYFVWLGRPRPDVRVVRRTRLGAALFPVRGAGTGDAEFDERFVVRGVDDAAALDVLTPVVRQAMVAGDLPGWEVLDGTLITAYDDVPTVEDLQDRANAITEIARLLA
jgi:hypothetical protein